MTVCSNCGFRNPDGNSICLKCGYVVSQHNNSKHNQQPKIMKPVSSIPQSNISGQQNISNNAKRSINRQEVYGNLQKQNTQQSYNNQHGQYNNNQQVQQNVNTQNTINSEQGLNYGNNYNADNRYTKQMYQQQAYGVVKSNGRNTKNPLFIIGIIVAIIFIIVAIIGIKVIGKILTGKQEQYEQEIIEQEEREETAAQLHSGTLYSSSEQEIFNENGVNISTNLADATVENNTLTLLVHISNNSAYSLNIELTNILTNALSDDSYCDNIITVDKSSTTSENIVFNLEQQFDNIYSVEFRLHIYSEDSTFEINTDNCMLSKLNTNNPEVIKAHNDNDKSSVITLDEALEGTEDIVTDIDRYTVGNSTIGYFAVDEPGWMEDTNNIYSEEGDNCIINYYSAYSSDASKVLFVSDMHITNNDLEIEYPRVLNELNISENDKYNTDVSNVSYSITYDGGVLNLDTVVMDYINNDIITVYYADSNCERNEFLEDSTKLLRSYTKCNLSKIEIR